MVVPVPTDANYHTNLAPTLGDTVLKAHLGTDAERRERLGGEVVVPLGHLPRRSVPGITVVGGSLPLRSEGTPMCRHSRPEWAAKQQLSRGTTIRARGVSQLQQAPVEGLVVAASSSRYLGNEVLCLLHEGLRMPIGLWVPWGGHYMVNAPTSHKSPERGAGELRASIRTQVYRHAHIPHDAAQQLDCGV